MFEFFPAKADSNIVSKAYHYVVSDPWVGFIMIMCFIHLAWVYILLLVQLFQVGVACHVITLA